MEDESEDVLVIERLEFIVCLLCLSVYDVKKLVKMKGMSVFCVCVLLIDEDDCFVCSVSGYSLTRGVDEARGV